MENIRFLSEEELLAVAGGFIDDIEPGCVYPGPAPLPSPPTPVQFYPTTYPSISTSYSGVYSPSGSTYVPSSTFTSTYGNHSSTPKSL